MAKVRGVPDFTEAVLATDPRDNPLIGPCRAEGAKGPVEADALTISIRKRPYVREFCWYYQRPAGTEWGKLGYRTARIAMLAGLAHATKRVRKESTCASPLGHTTKKIVRVFGRPDLQALLLEMGKRGFNLSQGQEWECGPPQREQSFHASTPEEAIIGALASADESFGIRLGPVQVYHGSDGKEIVT